MFAGFTIPLVILFLDLVALLLCNGLYRTLARVRRWAMPAPRMGRQLVLTLGLQAVLLVLLIIAEPALRAHYRDWQQVVALIGLGSTVAFPALLLLRHLRRASF